MKLSRLDFVAGATLCSNFLPHAAHRAFRTACVAGAACERRFRGGNVFGDDVGPVSLDGVFV